ncbi:hypothetical protein MP228_010190 [Amoeboaphelidium protococcarum]|nr:hypothetical protein MP228_010190 [Amoeboaphelidium protococcarum]
MDQSVIVENHPLPSQEITWTQSFRDWVKDHYKVILLASGGMAIAGTGYYFYKGPGRKWLKKRGSDMKKQAEQDLSELQMDSGDQQEQTESQVEDPQDDAAANAVESVAVVEQDTVEESSKITAALSEEDKKSAALKYKNEGNAAFSAKDYQKAIESYTQAINVYQTEKDVSPVTHACAIFYGNRAACYAALKENSKAIEDCDLALKCDSTYVKGLIRRAQILEKEGRLHDCLADYTTACFLEKFQSQHLMESADRVLRKLAELEAVEMFSPKQAVEAAVDGEDTNALELPSSTFLNAYLNSYSYSYLTTDQIQAYMSEGTGVEANSPEMLTVDLVQQFQEKNLDKALTQAQSLSNQVDKFTDAYLHSMYLNIMGTLQYLAGKLHLAQSNLQASIELVSKLSMELPIKQLYMNSMIKLASMQVEIANDAKCIEASQSLFEQAMAKAELEDPDWYYHRAQIHFLLQETKSAKELYLKATALYGTQFQDLQDSMPAIYARIQRAVIESRDSSPKKAERLFDQLVKEYPQCADIYYYRGELMLEAENVAEAIKCFDKAIQLKPDMAMAYLNKAIVLSHISGDMAGSEELVLKVLELDPKCDLAYMHYAQLLTSQNKIDDAIRMYEKALKVVRGPMDAQNTLMGLEAVRAQKIAMERVGISKI